MRMSALIGGFAVGARIYRITLKGHLSARFAAAFDGFDLELGPGEATLVGSVIDQAHLYGVLEQIRDLGLELLRVDIEA